MEDIRCWEAEETEINRRWDAHHHLDSICSEPCMSNGRRNRKCPRERHIVRTSLYGVDCSLTNRFCICHVALFLRNTAPYRGPWVNCDTSHQLNVDRWWRWSEAKTRGQPGLNRCREGLPLTDWKGCHRNNLGATERGKKISIAKQCHEKLYRLLDAADPRSRQKKLRRKIWSRLCMIRNAISYVYIDIIVIRWPWTHRKLE